MRKLHAQEIDKIASRLAAPVYGMGTRMRQVVARTEDFCLVSIAFTILHSTAQLQRYTSRGKMTHPDDPSHPHMRQAYKVGLYGATACMLLFVNLSCRAPAGVPRPRRCSRAFDRETDETS